MKDYSMFFAHSIARITSAIITKWLLFHPLYTAIEMHVDEKGFFRHALKYIPKNPFGDLIGLAQ